MLIGLQFLRCIGCLLVVHAHLTHHYVGYYFLDVFFIVSAFVMGMLMTRPQLSQNKFVKDRLTRAVPFYWSLTFIIFAIALVAPSLLGTGTADPMHLLKSLFFIPYENAQGILSPLLPVAWTMNYEILLYVFSCLAFGLAPRHRLAFVAAALIAINFIGRLLVDRYEEALLYAGWYMLDFPLGLLLWHLYEHHRQRLAMSLRTALTVIALTSAFMLYAEQSLVDHIDRFWLYGLPSTVLIWATLCCEPHIPRGRLTTVMVWIGDASFSIYLIHVFVIEAVFKLVPRLLPGFELSLPVMVLTFLLSVIAGLLVDRYYDKPLSRWFRDRIERMGPFGRMTPLPAGGR
ncbi:MAG: acyltransferase [Perlucidibaca sp.]